MTHGGHASCLALVAAAREIRRSVCLRLGYLDRGDVPDQDVPQCPRRRHADDSADWRDDDLWQDIAIRLKVVGFERVLDL
jgi:hypothetical protein